MESQEACEICNPKHRNPLVRFYRFLKRWVQWWMLVPSLGTRRDDAGGVIIDEPLYGVHYHILSEELRHMTVQQRFSVFGLLHEDMDAEDILLRKQAENEAARSAKEPIPWPEAEGDLGSGLRREYAALLGSRSYRFKYLEENWKELEEGEPPIGAYRFQGSECPVPSGGLRFQRAPERILIKR